MTGTTMKTIMRKFQLVSYHYLIFFFIILNGTLHPSLSFSQIEKESGLSTEQNLQPIHRYVGQDHLQPITFGLEVELDVEKYSQILEYYKPMRSNPENPEDKYEPTDDEWNKLTMKEKLELFRFHHFKEKLIKGKLFSRWEGTDLIKYVKLGKINSTDSKVLDFWKSLHPTIAVEPRGNVEVNGLVFKDLREISNFFKKLKTHIGEGDSQAHVVFPDRPINNIFGLALYFHDKSFLRRLVQEHYEFLENPKLTPAIQANSDWDGLFSNIRKLQIKKIEKLIEEKNFPRDEYSRVYRAGIPTINRVAYPAHLLGFELRNEDNPSENTRTYVGSYGRLVENMDMISRILEIDPSLNVFSDFDDLEVPYDLNLYEVEKTHGLVEVDALKKNIDFFHKRMNQIIPHLTELEKSQLNIIMSEFNENSPIWNKIETHTRNFFSARSTMHAIWHIFRNWDHYPVISTLPDSIKSEAINKINTATIEFIKDLLVAHKNYSNSAFSRKLRIAFAKWAESSEIYLYFSMFESLRNIGSSREFVQENQILNPQHEINHFPKSNQLVDLASSKKDKTKSFLEMLAQGIDVNSIDRNHYTSLSMASVWGKENLVKLLLNNDANPTLRTLKGGTPLIQAAYENELNTVEILLNNIEVRKHIDDSNENQLNAIMFAIRNKNLNMVMKLIQAGSNPDQLVIYKDQKITLLKFAENFKDDRITEYFKSLPKIQNEFISAFNSINQEEFIRVKDLWSKGAFFPVGELGTKMLKEFLEKIKNGSLESNLEILNWAQSIGAFNLNSEYFNPLIFAIKNSESTPTTSSPSWLIDTLLNSSSLNPYTLDEKGLSALDYALERNDLKLIYKLIQMNLPFQNESYVKANLPAKTIIDKVKNQTNKLFTLLKDPSKTETPQLVEEVKEFLKLGVNMSQLSLQGESLMILALERKFFEIFALFLKSPSKINQISPLHGETVLTYAIKNSPVEIITSLIKDKRINLYTMNLDYETPRLLIEDKQLSEILNEYKSVEKEQSSEAKYCLANQNPILSMELEQNFENLLRLSQQSQQEQRQRLSSSQSNRKSKEGSNSNQFVVKKKAVVR
jgi:ankyrin repeat protein